MNAAALEIEDFPSLISYLRQTGRIGPDESPRLTNLAGGVSNRTVLLERNTGESWVLKQALEKLRVKVDWRSDPRRIEREAAGMSALAAIAPPGSITPLIFIDRDQNLLAMHAVPQPHENWKTMLMSGRLEFDHVRQFATFLATIHRAGAEQRDRFGREFDDRSAFESLRLEPYYLYSAQRMPAAASFIDDLVAETRTARYTLVHGDYSPKNVLVHQGKLILLDHEVIHFGDGAFDIGFALTHLLSKAHALPAIRQRCKEAAEQFWQTYREQAGDKVPESRACRHTLACLLARCVGRSPLEYLTVEGAARQANIATSFMVPPPRRVIELIREFIRRIDDEG
jgi:aminoglycoside phosphotransferase (APT) family kinase protein